MEGVVIEIFKSVLGILTIAAAVFGTWGIKRLMTRFGMQIDEDKERQIREITQNAVFFAEAWAAKKFKIDEKLTSGEEKMNKAFEKMLKKIPGITVAEAKELIEEELPKVGLGAAGFIGALGKKAMLDQLSKK